MTTREILIEDMQGMETILCMLENPTKAPELTDRQVKTAICRCLWHILKHEIRQIDEERRNK